MFRLIKWLFFLAIIGVVLMAITGEKFRGKTIEEHLAPIIGSKEFKEAVHDMRAIVGQGLKTAGEVISEDVTDDERKQLDGLVKQEMQTGQPVQVSPMQTALPPQAQAQAQPEAQKKLPQRPSAQQMATPPRTVAPTTALPAAPMAQAQAAATGTAPRTVLPQAAAPRAQLPAAALPAAPAPKGAETF